VRFIRIRMVTRLYAPRTFVLGAFFYSKGGNKMNVFIGGAWPYANGSLHIGHLAGLLPGDVLARYHRNKGDCVLYVSGSDCHGTPISLRAKQENVEAKEIASRYHEEFVQAFEALNFSYDVYGRTDKDSHKDFVKKVVLDLEETGALYHKESEETYCEACEQFLPDRLVEGICPVCQKSARGDQCDHCGEIFDDGDLLEPRCKICQNKTSKKKTKHAYFALSNLQEYIEEFTNEHKDRWRINAVNNTSRYLKEGLKDRAITRDLAYGVKVPLEGYQGKSIYVWVDAVLGYLSTAQEQVGDLTKYFSKLDREYYVHGKDNIPFHTIIFPALKEVIGLSKQENYIVSSEYLTLEGRKISTSSNWAIWLPYITANYQSDAIRYFLLTNNPEKRDADFSWREFVYSTNAELLGAWGNLVNRTFKFISKHNDHILPKTEVKLEIVTRVQGLYKEVEQRFEHLELKGALDSIFEQVRALNKFFDEETPWIAKKEDKDACDQTISTCLYAIANLAQLLEPFLPDSSRKVLDHLGIHDISYQEITKIPAKTLDNVDALFSRIDVKKIEQEEAILKEQQSLRT